jgi:hypothetical protein
MTELQNVITLLENTFDKAPWHGPSVKAVISGISQAQSLSRLNNSHTIIELVSHMTSWRIFTTKRLQGDVTFKMTGELNFPANADWKKVVHDLDDSQVALMDTIKKFDDKKLNDLVLSTTHQYTYYTLMHSTIHHDLYHSGQIMIIKKHFGF